MKVKSILLITTIVFTLNTHAQITNNGFENWSGSDPVGWVSTNGLMIFGNPQSIYQSSNSHSGSSACEMHAVHITSKPPGIFIPDYTGSIFLGVQVGFNSIRGIPYTSRPAQLEFWNTYLGSVGDTASGLVALTKWNTTSGNRDTIATGYFLRSTFDSVFTKSSMVLTYSSNENPDTAIIMFASVTVSSTQAGAVFTIDDLVFTGGNVGVKENIGLNEFTFYPNPAKNNIVLDFNELDNINWITLIDMHGKTCYRNDNIMGTKLTIDVESLSRGLYFIQVSDGNSIGIKKLIIE